MKKFVVFAIAMLMVLGLSGSVSAEVYTLDDCIELALKTRASIIRARGAEQAAAADKRSAMGAFLPQLRGSYSYSKGTESDIVPSGIGYDSVFAFPDTTIFVNGADTTIVVDVSMGGIGPYSIDAQDQGPNKSLNLRADMSLFDLSNIFNFSAARTAHAKAKLDVIASEQDLIYSVKVSYYAYLAYLQNVETQEEAAKRAEEQLKLVESKYELGSAAKSDVLKQKVQFGNDRLALLKAINSVANAKAALAFTVGLDPRNEHEFSTSYNINEYDGSLDEAILFGTNHNPTLLAQAKSVEYASHNVKATKATYLPTLSGYYNFSKNSGTVSYPVTFERSSISKSYGFSISMNIFDGFFREKRVTAAKVARNNAQAGYSDLHNRIASDVKVAYLEIEQLKVQKQVSEENVAAADEDLKITQEKYNLGAATILEMLDAQVSSKRAQVSLINVDFDLNLAVAKLEKSMGKM